jgi:beta-1,2-mannobiose phosphorylase / 1,2-beta-oligomannan phosphorylase
MPEIRRSLITASFFAALFAVSSVACADEFPGELVRFRPSDRNPVFTAAKAGSWDVKIRERGWILREGDLWRMWYTGYDGTPEGIRRLGYATSRDGIAWTRAAENPLFRDGWVEDMQVIRHGDTYLMFAEGAGDQAQWLTSRDGLTWKREEALDVRNKDGKPIEPGPYGTPTVWFDDGVWNLFYERRDLGVWLARSADLQVWINVADTPVLSVGPEPYDRLMIAMNQIVKHDGRYYAYYHGSGTPEKPRLWTTNLAVSTDLIHWKKFPDNPLLPERENKSSGIVVFDGKQYRLYTMHDKVDVHLP